MKKDGLFVFGDCDSVRLQVERLLFANELDKLKHFSSSLTKAIESISHKIENELQGEIIMAGGDDILFSISKDNYSLEAITTMRSLFTEETSCLISFGIGKTIEQAFINLAKAKAGFAGKIIETI